MSSNREYSLKRPLEYLGSIDDKVEPLHPILLQPTFKVCKHCVLCILTNTIHMDKAIIEVRILLHLFYSARNYTGMATS